jgi:hypothetical protein
MYSPRFPAGLCILLAQAGLAQYDPSPLLTPDDLSGARVATTGRYDGQALYGYIDGGAEVYLEYGFTRLTLQTVDLNGTTVNVELYRMKDSAAAFGIFSISRFRCRPVDSLGRYSCPSAYQVQIARGKYFLRASNATGTPGKFTTPTQHLRHSSMTHCCGRTSTTCIASTDESACRMASRSGSSFSIVSSVSRCTPFPLNGTAPI